MPDPVDRFAMTRRDLRAERGLTQDALGQAADMDAAEVRRPEGGKRDLGLRVLERLSVALDVTISKLLGY